MKTWEKRHYQMVAKSDKMFKEKTQGEEVDF